jgi:hypothetical protein
MKRRLTHLERSMDYRGIHTVQSNTTRQPLPPEVLAAAIFAGFDETRGGGRASRASPDSLITRGSRITTTNHREGLRRNVMTTQAQGPLANNRVSSGAST